MKPSSEFSGVNGSSSVMDLEFPEFEYRPLPPQVSLNFMLDEIEKSFRANPKFWPTEEERLQAKNNVEFVL
jgi:hypothetical protein